MDRQTIDDQHVVARYLADQLSDADREAFEAYCRKNPEVYREIEAAARLKVGLAKLGETARLEGLISAPQSRPLLFRYAAAGAGVLAAGTALVASFVLMQAPMMGASVAEVSGRFGTPLPVAASYELLRMRESTDLDQRIALPNAPAAIEFRVLPDSEGAPRYSVTLSTDDGPDSKTIATAHDLIPGPDHYLSLFVRSAELRPGIYLLFVDAADGHEKAPPFRFEVRKH